MKKSVISLLAFVCFTAASMASPYTLQGKLSGGEGIRALLLKPVSLDRSDTLGIVSFHGDSGFQFEGVADTPFEACVRIVSSGTDDVDIPVFIEPGMDTLHITAALDGRHRHTTEGGGPLQECLRRYEELERAAAAERDSLRESFYAEHDMSDIFWVIQLRGANQALSDRFEERENLFLSENDNMVSAWALAHRLRKLVRDKTLHVKYGLLGAGAQSSARGAMLKDLAEKSARISVGGIAPDFTMAAPDGSLLSLHGVKAKIKILDFWASWCGPCRAETPNVRNIYEKFHDKGLEIVSVSLDTDKNLWIKAIEKDGMDWYNCSELNAGNTARNVYQVHGIPYMLILDENNRIISEGLRGERLHDFIADHL